MVWVIQNQIMGLKVKLQKLGEVDRSEFDVEFIVLYRNITVKGIYTNWEK